MSRAAGQAARAGSGASPLQRLTRRLAQDRKKASILAVLGLLALLLWLRAWLVTTPSSASASPSPAAPAAPKTADNPKSAVATGSAPAERPTVVVDLPHTIERDPFVLNPTGYTPLPETDLPEEGTPKSPFDGADEVAEIRTDGLRLQTTILGQSPAAIINGEMIQVGESYEEFKLIEVRPASVIIEKNGAQVELAM